MLRLLIAAALVVAALVPTVTVVPDPAPSTAAAPQTDDERMAAYVAENWPARFVPFFDEKAAPLADVRAAVAGGLDAAGTRFGLRPPGEATPWNFVVRGEGVVTAAKTDTRAATASLDTDGDGTADVTLQLGPVVKGTTLRDAATFLNFSDFRDQIAFAKLARALNDHALSTITLPRDDLVGKRVKFLGAFTLRSPTEAILVTPVAASVE